MNKVLNSKKMVAEKIKKEPALDDFDAFFRKAASTPDSQLIPKKHAMVLSTYTIVETRNLFDKKPKMPIKMVLITILKPLTNDIPPALLLKLTENIINVWTGLTTEAQQKSAKVLAA